MGFADIYASKPVQTGLVCYGVVMAIVSIVTANTAFSAFQSSTAEYSSLMGSWQTAPITGILLSSTDNCPAGYDLLEGPTWKGSESSACACPSTATDFDSSDTSTCTTNQTTAGCLSQPAVESVDLEFWRGKYICVKREGEGQLKSKTAMRPTPSSSGTCKSGYTFCGATGTTADTRAVCVPSSTTCPVTGATSATTTPSGYSASSMQATSETTSWYTRSQYSGEMPINQIKIVLLDDSEGGKRGDCFGTGKSQTSYGGKADSYEYTEDYPKKCSKSDDRWVSIDTLTETALLTNHFNLEANCTGATTTDDYVSTSTMCTAGNGGTTNTNPDCMVNGLRTASQGALACGADTICKNVAYQSKCGALTRFANEAGLKWTVYVRREVYWKESCEASMVDLAKAEGPVKSIRNNLQGNFILNILVNIFLGIIFPCMVLQNLYYGDVKCVPGEGEVEKKLLESIQKYLKALFCIVKLIPAILALSTLSGVSSLMERAAEGNCAASDDDLTDLTFTDMYDNMEASTGALTTQVGVDCFSLVTIAMMAIYAMISGGSSEEGEKDAELDKEAGSGL